MLYGVSDRRAADVARAWEQEPQAELGFTSGVAASFESAMSTQFLSDQERLMGESIRKTVGALASHTGDMAKYPTVGRYGPVGYPGGNIGTALDLLDEQEPLIRALQAEGVDVQTRSEIEDAAAKRAEFLRTRAERAGTGGALVGTLAAGALQPEVILTMPLGASSAAPVLTAALIEAGIAMGTEAVVQGVRMASEERQRIGTAPTLGEAATNVAAAGGGAFVLTGALRGVAKLWSDNVAAGRVKQTTETRLSQEAVERGADHLDAAPVKTPAGLKAHDEATLEAVRAVNEGRLPDVETVYRNRFRDTLEAAAEREGRAVAADVAVTEAEAALRDISRARGARNALINARDGLKERGIPAEVKADAQGVTLSFETVGPGRREITLPREASRLEARQAVDAVTDELGLERLPRTKAERTALDLEARQAERTAAATPASQARALRERTQDGVVLDRSRTGVVRPFKTRKAADEFGRRTFGDGFEVVKTGRGFGLVEAEAPVARQTREFISEASDTPITRQDVIDHDTAHTAELERAQREIASEVNRPVDGGDEVPDVTVGDDLDLDTMVPLPDEDGGTTVKTLREWTEELDEDAGWLTSMRNCLGGGA